MDQPINEEYEQFIQMVESSNAVWEYTLVHWAVHCCNSPALMKLVADGHDINAQDAYGRTPLHIACECKIWSQLWLLIEMGADKTIVDREGNTPLGTACKKNFPLGVETLISANADPDPKYINMGSKQMNPRISKMLHDASYRNK